MKKSINTKTLYGNITSVFFHCAYSNTSARVWASMKAVSEPFFNDLPIQTSLKDIITAE